MKKGFLAIFTNIIYQNFEKNNFFFSNHYKNISFVHISEKSNIRERALFSDLIILAHISKNINISSERTFVWDRIKKLLIISKQIKNFEKNYVLWSFWNNHFLFIVQKFFFMMFQSTSRKRRRRRRISGNIKIS